MYGRAVFFLKSEAEANQATQKGIVVGGLFVQVEPLESWYTDYLVQRTSFHGRQCSCAFPGAIGSAKITY